MNKGARCLPEDHCNELEELVLGCFPEPYCVWVHEHDNLNIEVI